MNNVVNIDPRTQRNMGSAQATGHQFAVQALVEASTDTAKAASDATETLFEELANLSSSEAKAMLYGFILCLLDVEDAA